MDRSMRRFRTHVPILLIVALALALRLAGLTRHGLWVDEGFSVYLSSHSLPEMVAGTVADQHPPLYYMLLGAWGLVFGRSEVAIRGLSALLGTGTVLLLYYAGQRLFTRTVGELAALALALSPAHIWYSQEVRMYVLLGLLLTASAYLAWRIVEEPGKWAWTAYVLTSLAALYTQYFALFVLLFENLLLIPLALARGKRSRLWPWLAAQGCLVVGFAPWTLVMVYQALCHAPTWIPHPSWSDLADTLLYLTRGPWVSPLPLLERLAAWIWLAAVPLGAGLWALRQRESRRPALWTWGWLLIPLLTIFLLSQHWRLFQPKQLLFLLPPLCLLTGLGIGSLPRIGRIVAAVLLVSLLLHGLYTVYFGMQKQEWREAATYIGQEIREGDCLFFNPAAGAPTLNYYLQEEWPQDGYPHPYQIEIGGYVGDVSTPERVEARLAPLAAQCQRIWLVEYSPGFWDPQRLIVRWLETHGRPAPLLPHFEGLEVRLYRIMGPGNHLPNTPGCSIMPLPIRSTGTFPGPW